jgi:anti-anti-sigma factor
VAIQLTDAQFSIRLSGALDLAAAEQVRMAVNQIDTDDNHPAVVDLHDLTFCDPAGLHELLVLREELCRRHPQVAFIRTPPRIRRLMEIAKVNHLFTSDRIDPP